MFICASFLPALPLTCSFNINDLIFAFFSLRIKCFFKTSPAPSSSVTLFLIRKFWCCTIVMQQCTEPCVTCVYSMKAWRCITLFQQCCFGLPVTNEQTNKRSKEIHSSMPMFKLHFTISTVFTTIPFYIVCTHYSMSKLPRLWKIYLDFIKRSDFLWT